MDKSKRHFNINSNYCRDIKSFLRSIVALLMAVMLIFGSTFAWIEGSKKAETNGNECTVSAGAGLQFIEVSKGDIDKGVLTLGGTSNLQDCSSVDGRNIFFPTTGSIRPDTATATITDNIKFRSAVESDFMAVSNDKSLGKYLRKDFIIKSLESKDVSAGATSGVTKIYIDQSTEFKGDADFLKALRVSLNFNDGTDPIVICPGLTYDTDTRPYSPVASINSDGSVKDIANMSALQHGHYYYGKTPVYKLPHGESERVTLTVWLEGTDDKCNEALANKAFEMNLVLSTEDSNMRTVKFIDYTPSTWVKNQNATMYVVNSQSKTSTWVMSSSDGITYTARIPKDIPSIYFQRTTKSDKTLGEQDAHNSWSVGDSDDLSNKSVFYAIGCGPGVFDGHPDWFIDDKNYGYWSDSADDQMIDLYFTDNHKRFNVGGSSTVQGHSPFIYIYNSKFLTEGDRFFKAYGGFEMEYVKQNSSKQPVYHMIIPADENCKIIINQNGSDTVKNETCDFSAIYNTYVKNSSSKLVKIGLYEADNTNQLTYWDASNFN